MLYKHPTFKKHRQFLLFDLVMIIAASLMLFGFPNLAHADTIDVTAKVPATIPTEPPVITSPFDQQHVTNPDITTVGTCGAFTAYINLYRNGIFAGVSPCTAGHFSVQLNLFVGANSLVATAYNSTDDVGPSSATVTVYYDPIVIPPAPPVFSTAPITVSYIDNTPFNPALSEHTASLQPTISGRGPANAILTITFNPDGITCKTRVLATGIWSCTLASQLGPGRYHVTITALTADGKLIQGPSFILVASASQPGFAVPGTGTGMYISANQPYIIHHPDETWTWYLTVHGGKAPYKITVNWGDSQTTTQISQTTDAVIEHNYNKVGVYTVIVAATDVDNLHAQLQLAAAARPDNRYVANTQLSPEAQLETVAIAGFSVFAVFGLFILFITMQPDMSFSLARRFFSHFRSK
ncbi:MAG TPA: hypothetical protein VH144_02560 [Candidatus Saccharimonadales bacterium]|jgi:hypothetical protein|nr:hypothetical protein [Candidatus Saccharimonadales bacterium]